MHFRHYSLRIKISFKISFQCSLKLILIKKFHGTFSKVLWNFLNNIWTTPVVPVIPNRKFCMIYPTTLINLVIPNMHRAEVNGNSLWDIISILKMLWKSVHMLFTKWDNILCPDGIPVDLRIIHKRSSHHVKSISKFLRISVHTEVSSLPGVLKTYINTF